MSLRLTWGTSYCGRFCRLLRDLHNVLGLWLVFIVLWAVTGIYFAFPDAFNALSDSFRDGEQETSMSLFIQHAVAWTVRLHFGR
jgi:uncharacterized iron-regulated membrane protein